MPLQDKVGRNATTGRSCKNRKEDQSLVMSLLNRIPISEGGAENTLTAPVVSKGYVSDGLYYSILYFQSKNFPGKPDGVISPSGPTFRRLNELGTKYASPVTPAKGAWDNIATPSVYNPLAKGLADNNRLDAGEVFDIIWSVFEDGTITQFERDDLEEVAKVSKSLDPKSKALLDAFKYEMAHSAGSSGPYRFNTDSHRLAVTYLRDFFTTAATTAFPHLTRARVTIGLLMRVGKPTLIRQGMASVCGPAAMMFNYASDAPASYTRLALDLFQKGQGTLGRLLIKPDHDVRNYDPPYSITHADWLVLASLRDSENLFLDFQSTGTDTAGITLPSELWTWFNKAGYRDVIDNTNLTNMFHKEAEDIDSANALFKKGYRVCLFISANMTESDMKEEDNQMVRGSVFTRHWVVQRSPIDRSNDKVKFQVFTWGNGEYKIPNGSKDLPLDNFLENYYGYIAAKP